MSYYKSSYVTNEIFKDYFGKNYLVTTGGNIPSQPFNPNNIVDSYIVWGDLRLQEYEDGGGGGGSASYQQITRLGTDANTDILLNISRTTTFNKPPIEVLKFRQGTQNIITTLNTFSASEATDFSYDNTFVEFDDQIHLINDFNLTMSTPTQISGVISGNNTLVALNHFNDSLNADYGDTDFIYDYTVVYETGIFDKSVKVDVARNFKVNSSIKLGNYNNWTVEEWFKCKAGGDYPENTTFIFIKNGSYGSLGFYVINSTTLRLEYRDANGTPQAQNVTLSSTFIDGLWHHLACVYDGSNIKVFYDGTLLLTKSEPNGVWYDSTSNSRIQIGKWGDVVMTAHTDNMWIDEFAIWAEAKYNSNFTPSNVPYSISQSRTISGYISQSNVININDYEKILGVSINE